MDQEDTEEIILTEELLLKDPKTPEERNYITKLNLSSILFHFSEINLLKTNNVKARELYLGIISKKLGQISKNSFEFNSIDNYVNTFLVSPTLLKNENFNTATCKALILRIQALLTYFLYKEMLYFFRMDSTEYLFSWDNDIILDYLEVFNESMNMKYCFASRNLNKLEQEMCKDGAEDNIVNYLISLYNINKDDIRPIHILISSLKWINSKFFIPNNSSDNDKIYIVAESILNENGDPNPIYNYFVNIMDRLYPFKESDVKDVFPVRLCDQSYDIIQKFINDQILEKLLTFIISTDNYKLAHLLYYKIMNDYFNIFHANDCFNSLFLKYIFDILEYAAVSDNFNIYNTLKIALNPGDYNISSQDISELITYKLKYILKTEMNLNLLTKKLYPYILLNYRAFSNEASDIMFKIPMTKSINIAESILRASKKCIQYAGMDQAQKILTKLLPIIKDGPIDANTSYCVAFIECLDVVIRNSTDSRLTFVFRNVFVPLMTKIIHELILPQQKPVLNALKVLIANSNFPCFITLNGNSNFIDLIKELVKKMNIDYIEVAGCIYQAFSMISQKKEKSLQSIYIEVVNIAKHTEIDDSTKFQIISMISFLDHSTPPNCDVDLICSSLLDAYPQLLEESAPFRRAFIGYYKLGSYEKIFPILLNDTKIEDLLNISKLSTTLIDKLDVNFRIYATNFAKLIIDFILDSKIEVYRLDDEFVNLCSNSLSFILPLLTDFPQEYLIQYFSILGYLASVFRLSDQCMSIFIRFYLDPVNARFIDFAWVFFDKIKSVFINGTSDYQIDGIAYAECQLLFFMIFMYKFDPERAISYLSQIEGNVLAYTYFMRFMKDAQNMTLNDPKDLMRTKFNFRQSYHSMRRPLF